MSGLSMPRPKALVAIITTLRPADMNEACDFSRSSVVILPL
jgi:hypothetical protein